jgi:hypothetical protein
MFARVMGRLRPGGLFVYEFEPVPDEPKNDNTWTGDWVCGPDGAVIAWRNRMKRDPNTHVWECLFVVEKFVDGRLVEAEANERTGRNFTVDEAVQYAQAAGFEHIRATDWLTDDPPSKDSTVVTVQCRKAREQAG